ncbi:hypothetical protein PWT90_07109 [Aphanocladium album]|nr:hypothetical protein PWT90_07109 [Aphanocladium album]
MGAVVLALLVLCAYTIVSQVLGLMRNIATAKRSGFKYIIVPVVIRLPIAYMVYEIGSAIAKRAMSTDLVYRRRHLWRERLDDVFIVVSPGYMVLHSANAEINSLVTSQRERFPKFVEAYGVLGVFGPNLITTEGAEWRHHRKLTSGSFNEANAALTFEEAVRQSESMLQKWTNGGEQGVRNEAERGGEKSNNKHGWLLESVAEDVTKLTLHIINYIGFGLRMLWPGEKLPAGTEPELAKFLSLKAPAGHHTSFVDATDVTHLKRLRNQLTNKDGPERLPFDIPKRAAQEARDYVKYCNELLDMRLAEAKQWRPEAKTSAVGMDLLGHLARTGHDDGREPDRRLILGNAFILQLAGHETTATAMHHIIILLACHPEMQRRMQKDVDSVVGDADPSTWEYSKVVNALLGSHVGAAVYETLRLMPPVVAVPKKAAAEEVVTKDGQSYTIPKGMPVSLDVVGSAMNPRYWPTRAKQDGSGQTDICDWRPTRWLRTTTKPEGARDTAADDQGEEDDEEASYDKNVGPTSSEKLFRPVRGSFLAFSDGARSCIGRRVAQTEMMAALAVIFRKHSIELVVEGGGRERAAYERASREALETLKTARSVVTLKLADGQHIGLRIVERGEESFASWVE